MGRVGSQCRLISGANIPIEGGITAHAGQPQPESR
jgi:hypothetical protein